VNKTYVPFQKTKLNNNDNVILTEQKSDASIEAMKKYQKPSRAEYISNTNENNKIKANKN
jgi:hypothetical protein